MESNQQQKKELQPRFKNGTISLTPTVRELLTYDEIGKYFLRHAQGYWGEWDDKKAIELNERSLKDHKWKDFVVSKFNHQSDRQVTYFTMFHHNYTLVFFWDELALVVMRQFLPAKTDL